MYRVSISLFFLRFRFTNRGFLSTWMVVSPSIEYDPFDPRQFCWCLFSSLIFFIGFTLFQGEFILLSILIEKAPYMALFPELTREKNDRIHTVIFQSIFGGTASTIAIFMPLFIVST